MSNWGTAVQTVTERVHRYGTSDPDIVKRAISEAIRRYSNHDFWFNQRTYDFSTADGVYEYGVETTSGAADGYPEEMLKPIKLSLKVSGTWYNMELISIDRLRDEFLSTGYKGFPKYWTWFNKEILVFPTANDAYTMRLDYTADIGTPVPSYSASSWAYTVGGVTLTDSYSNDWFIEAPDLIYARAVYYIASQHLSNFELAQSAKMLEAEQLDEMYIDSEASQISPNPRPWY